MKRITLYIGLMCLFAGWCTSCSNDNEEGIGGDLPILLTAQATDALRARSTITDGQPLLQNMEAGVYINEDGGTNASIGSNRHYKVNASGGLDLQGGLQPYYPPSGRSVKISAYYPYNSGTADSYDFSVEANQSTDGGYNASDLLYSAQANYVRQSTAHSLPFEHKLSQIIYRLVVGNEAPSFTGATVSIMNVLPTTEFNRTTGTLGSAKGTSTTIVPNTSGAIVVPQTIAGGTRLIKVSAEGNDYYYKPSSPLALESGKSYDFDIRVEKTELQVTYTVSDWTNGTVADNGGGVSAYNYRVGDYYPDPNVDLNNATEKAKIKGIVYWVDPTSNGKHGRVLGLKENNGVKWADSESITNATSLANGRENMRTIYGLSADFSGYPVFAWIHSLNDADEDYSDADATGVWYLPARYELGHDLPSSLSFAYNSYGKSNFNARLTGAGGAALRSDASRDWYWSSSLRSGILPVLIIEFRDYIVAQTSMSTDICIARCILAF